MQHDNIRALTSTFNTSKYSVDLGVVQSFVVSGDITWADGSSLLANEVYSVVTSNSAGWGTNVAESGPKWDENYSTVNSLSDTWSSAAQGILKWDQNYSTVNSLSDTWGEIYNVTLSAANWNDVYEMTGPIGLADAFQIANLHGFSRLKDRPWTPVLHPALKHEEDEDISEDDLNDFDLDGMDFDDIDDIEDID